jgi:plasmid stabilization system protein ParE
VTEIRFHPEAQAEYQAAFEWYRDRSERAAGRSEFEVERVLELSKANPEMFPRYDGEHRLVMLRRFPYFLVYRSQPERIEIIAVAHAHRSPGYWKRQG